MARLMTQKLISIRCDPPLPGNLPTPRRQVLSYTIVNIMQKVQQRKQLEGREGKEADTLRVEVKKEPHKDLLLVRERERKKEARGGVR